MPLLMSNTSKQAASHDCGETAAGRLELCPLLACLATCENSMQWCCVGRTSRDNDGYNVHVGA
jgi:hypothetical protein